MRVLVISDIHANLVALEAVFTAAAGRYDVIWCLGDVVGYGPKPNECVALMRQYAAICVIGNHDWVAVDLPGVDFDQFNDYAKRAMVWTREKLSQESRDYLLQLARVPVRPYIDKSILLTHASPRMPVWEYIDSPEVALANFLSYSEEICLFGHSHVQMFGLWRPIPQEPIDRRYVALNTEHNALVELLLPPQQGAVLQLSTAPHFRLMLNPGSVGQPRDEDPRAAFAILDLQAMTWQFERVEYRIEDTQRQMRRAHLPQELIDRLSFGY